MVSGAEKTTDEQLQLVARCRARTARQCDLDSKHVCVNVASSGCVQPRLDVGCLCRALSEPANCDASLATPLVLSRTQVEQRLLSLPDSLQCSPVPAHQLQLRAGLQTEPALHSPRHLQHRTAQA